MEETGLASINNDASFAGTRLPRGHMGMTHSSGPLRKAQWMRPADSRCGGLKRRKELGNGDGEGVGEVLQVEGAWCHQRLCSVAGEERWGAGFRSWGTRSLCCRVCTHKSMGSYRIILSKQIMGLVLHFRKIKNDWKGINPRISLLDSTSNWVLGFAPQLPSWGWVCSWPPAPSGH